MENTPVFVKFKYESIPSSVIQKCKQHLNEYYVIEEASEELIRNLIYLSWLYANGYVFRFEDGIDFPDPHYEYEDPDGEGHILNSVWMQYDLYEIIPYLKLIDKRAESSYVLPHLN